MPERITNTNQDGAGADPLALPPGQAVSVTAADGARLEGFRAGPTGAPTILLVHGAVVNGTFWAPVTSRLVAAGFDVVAIDQRAHGRSERGGAPFTAATLAGDLRAWIDQLDPRDVVVVGHSMGCAAAMLHAIEPHERTRAVVLSGAMARANKALALLARLTMPLTHPRVLRRPRLGPFLIGALAGGSDASPSLLEAVRAEFLRFDRQTLAENNRMVGGFDVTAQLPSITAPVHVVAGERDRATPVRGQRALAALIPGARLTVLSGCGHQVMFDAPDEVSRLIGEMAHTSGQA